jgi:DNA-binding NarL/FixJ family response regulator
MPSADKKLNIVIADNQYLIIEALKYILGDYYNILSVVSSKNDLNIFIQTHQPDLLIVDFLLLDFNGIDDLRDIKADYPNLSIIILSNSLTLKELTGFHNIGINTLLHKNAGKDELFACIEAAVNGKKYYSDVILDMMLDNREVMENQTETVHLTASETEIVRLIAQGLTTKEIAAMKFLSFHTIMTHRKNILRKLGVSNSSELTMYAIRNGIIDTIEYNI